MLRGEIGEGGGLWGERGEGEREGKEDIELHIQTLTEK